MKCQKRECRLFRAMFSLSFSILFQPPFILVIVARNLRVAQLHYLAHILLHESVKTWGLSSVWKCRTLANTSTLVLQNAGGGCHIRDGTPTRL